MNERGECELVYFEGYYARECSYRVRRFLNFYLSKRCSLGPSRASKCVMSVFAIHFVVARFQISRGGGRAPPPLIPSPGIADPAICHYDFNHIERARRTLSHDYSTRS